MKITTKRTIRIGVGEVLAFARGKFGNGVSIPNEVTILAVVNNGEARPREEELQEITISWEESREA